MMAEIESFLLRKSRGVASRIRLMVYRELGMQQGKRNRMEGGSRVRRCSQIAIGDCNAFTQGCWLWPEDTEFAGMRLGIATCSGLMSILPIVITKLVKT